MILAVIVNDSDGDSSSSSSVISNSNDIGSNSK